MTPTSLPWQPLPPATVGQNVSDIDTPSLVVDLDAMERNITRMAAFAEQHKMLWRPHAKMHKSAALALQLMQAGAVGVCVQKTAEAEAMLAGGVRNIFISNEVVSLSKLKRVAHIAIALAAQNDANPPGPPGKLALAVDNPEALQRLVQVMADTLPGHNAVLDVFVEMDVGQGRCGTTSSAASLALAQEITRHPFLRFAGLQAYHGKAQHLRSLAEREAAIGSAVRLAVVTRALIEAAGIPVPLITGAGTGTMALEASSGVYGELQAGSFLFMDADYAANEADPQAPKFEHALFVKSQVVSTSPAHVVCDAGHKSHAIDSGLPRVWPLGRSAPLDYFNGGDEHGILRPQTPNSALPKLGDTVWLVPGHCDPTVNLHDQLVGVRGGLVNGVVEKLIRVDARGALT
jgi:D-serine deaminase-like pyridoxal phosphate-dependent protein